MCDPSVPQSECPSCIADAEAHAEHLEARANEPECEFCDGPCVLPSDLKCPCGCGGHPEMCGYRA